MPRFVILRHDWPHPHLDLLLEAGPVLKAWRLAAEPVPGEWVAAEPNADHRLMYLDYEGPVSGGRGAVSRWAVGECAGGVLTWDGGTAELQRDGEGWAFRWIVARRASEDEPRPR